MNFLFRNNIIIADKSASPRDSSKLFVYDTKTDMVTFDVFRNLHKHLPKDSLMIFNNTKVVPARINLFKDTGGKVEILLLINEWNNPKDNIKALFNKKAEIGSFLYIKNKKKIFEVLDKDCSTFFLKPFISKNEIIKMLSKYGKTPIPKYIKTSDTEKFLREKYQTIFAKEFGSVAAPTASLHFTDRVFNSLEKKGIKKGFVTLHVGMGTFASPKEENFKTGKLFKEFYSIPKQTAKKVLNWKAKNKPIVTVGTTATRAVESASVLREGRVFLKPGDSSTELFVKPPYSFNIPDILITNFHLPESSLVYLVESFLVDKKSKKNLFELYDIAIKNGFKFYSFGDSMLIK